MPRTRLRHPEPVRRQRHDDRPLGSIDDQCTRNGPRPTGTPVRGWAPDAGRGQVFPVDPTDGDEGRGHTLGVMAEPFVREDFTVPEHFVGAGFRLERLGPDHNKRDHDAWMSSIEHIHATPGFPDGSWPSPMSLQDDLADLVRHAEDFARRAGFTYSVLDRDEVIGCVYIYPTKAADYDASVQSWVRASRADMDVVLWRAMMAWLQTDWPFANVDYAVRS